LCRVTFDGCHMLCQMRKRARDSICPGDYCECECEYEYEYECECSKSSAIEHGITWHHHPRRVLVLPETGLWIRLATTRRKSSRKRTTHNSIEKIHAHDHLESTRVPFDQGSWEKSQVQRRLLCRWDIRAIVPLFHCPNGTQLKQQATSENCWCMRTMRARTLTSYQLNILTRIEWNRSHILHTLYSILHPPDFVLHTPYSVLHIP
jgi:hypothetical protein